MTDLLPVTFRRQRSGPFKGSITAVFPTLPSGYTGGDMTCYTPGEGHSGASRGWYYDTTRPATEAEYADTLKALRRLYEDPDDDPVRLVTVKRITQAMRDDFLAEQRRHREALRENPAGAPWVPA
jgi:hypothetical protein